MPAAQSRSFRMAHKGPRNPERSFGLSVGIVLSAIAALLVWRHRISRAEIAGGIGATLIFFGAVYPPALTYPSAWWWRFSKALGYVNARILLTVLFALVLTPLSILWRLIGKDPLMRNRTKWPGWSTYPPRYRDRTHYTRMF